MIHAGRTFRMVLCMLGMTATSASALEMCRLKTAVYNGPVSGTDWTSALAIDAAGNVYAAGKEWGPANIDDWRIIKWDPTLTTILASTRYDGPAGGSDWARDIIVDGLGNIVVGGTELTSTVTGGTNWRIRKYTPDLNVLLATTDYNGPGNGTDTLSNLMVDAAGNLVATGSEVGTIGGTNWRIRKWDPGISVLLGTTDYTGPGGSSDSPNTLAIDAAGNVLVGGNHFVAGTGLDWMVRKYDPTLTTLLCSTTFNGTSNSTDQVYGLGRDISGNVVVSGQAWDVVGGQNWHVRKYTPTLDTLLGATRFDGPASLADSGWSLGLGAAGHVAVVGSETTATGFIQARLMIWNADLTVLLSSTTFTGPGGREAVGRAAAYTPQGRLVMLGREEGAVTYDDWTVTLFGFDGGCPQPPVIPPPLAAAEGKLLVRGNLLRPGAGGYAVIAAKGPPGGTVDFLLYSNGGRAVARLEPVTLDGNGEGELVFDGRVEGKPLKAGVYWIVSSGAVKDRKPVMIATVEGDLKK